MTTLARYLKHRDVAIFYVLNRRIHCSLLDFSMKYITHFGSWFSAIVFPLVLILSGSQKAYDIGVHMAVSLTASQAVVHSIKRLVRRPRPFRVLSDAIAINPPACVYSFPSGHTAAAFSMTYVLMWYVPSLAMLFASLAGIVGISRIYLGVHYPTDVICGIIISYLTHILVLGCL